MHCIDLILIKKSELRNFKLSTLLDDKSILVKDSLFLEKSDEDNSLVYLDLTDEITAFPLMSNNNVYKTFGPGIMFINLKTDYFGGSGKESGSINITTKRGFKMIKSYDSIDKTLIDYGISQREGDHFYLIQDLQKGRIDLVKINL